MAKSGTINGKQSGNRPYLRLRWDIRSQDVANNRSRVRLRLYIVAPYRVSYSANKKGRLSGSNFTHTSGMSGTGEKLIRTQEVWTSHNSNGSKTATYSAWYDINITYSGSYIGRLSLSGTASLDTIPRASTLSSFSMGASLKEGTANTVRLGISRKSSSFTHDVQLRMGSATIASWNGQSTPSSLSLSESQVNNMLSRMSSSTSSTVTLRVQTKSGSSNIGSAVSRTATASVSSTVVPTINDRFDISISGSGADKTMGNYIQNMSKAKVVFTSSARGGAGVSRRTVTVDGTIHNGYNITSQTLSKSGSIPVKVEITDTRGRKASKTKDISVLAYSTPTISSFRVERESGNQSRAQITYSGTSSTLPSKNKVNIKVQRQLTGGSSWSTIDSRDDSGDDSGNFNRSIVDTGASTSSSYMYRVVATDTVKNTATREQSLSTARVLFDMNADKGIGIGKMHERGALDVAGSAYFEEPIRGAIAVEDTRDKNSPPIDYMNMGRGVYHEFKRRTVIDSPPIEPQNASYINLTTYVGWKDSSGGYPFQIAFGDNGEVATRTGVSSNSWGSWAEYLKSDSSGNFAIKNSNGQYSVFKKGGSVAFAMGSPTTHTTTGAHFQVYHDGRVQISGNEVIGVNRSNIPEGGNLNNYLEYGHYDTGNNKNTATLKNCPTGTSSGVEVFPVGSSTAQRLTQYDNRATYQRTYYAYGDKWYDWKKVY